MKRRDKPHPPLTSPTDLSIPGNRRLANLQEKNDQMPYIEFHFTTLDQQPNSFNSFMLGYASTVVPPLNPPYTFLSEPVKQIDTHSLMSLSSPQAKGLPDTQISGSTEQVSPFVQILTRLIDALSPKLNILFELKHKDLELRFEATSK
ncbi:MAG: hypothetical protein ACRCU2_30210 [Planktothrix sp.]